MTKMETRCDKLTMKNMGLCAYSKTDLYFSYKGQLCPLIKTMEYLKFPTPEHSPLLSDLAQRHASLETSMPRN